MGLIAYMYITVSLNLWSFTCIKIIFADPPSFNEGPTHCYVHVLLGDSISLVGGTGLDINPQATITWTAPSGTTVAVMNNDRYHLENGPEIVRLNITNTVLSDSGIWRCDATVSILSRGPEINDRK